MSTKDTEPMTRERVFGVRDRILNNCMLWIFGIDTTLRLVVESQFMRIPYTDKITNMKLLGQAHLLLIGGTGRGKTDSLTALSKSITAKHNRIQGTEDLRVPDITGGPELLEDVSGHKTIVFEPGPIFCNILFVDENSRIHPKTMSAMIEAMEERSITPPNKKINFGSDVRYKGALPLFPISGDLDDEIGPRWFSCMFTQNPFGEEEGTFTTPQAMWDRLTICLEIPRPPLEAEMKIRACNVVNRKIEPVTDLHEMDAASQYVYNIMRLSDSADEYLTRILRNTDPDPGVEKDTLALAEYVRTHVEKEKGGSPRVNFHLEAAARTHAFFAGDEIVKPEHVKAVAPSVVAHRVKLVPKIRHKKDARDVFAEILENTKVPRWKT
ncbi:MAG: hypothetical protein A2655_01105 [Candidatus Yanofskybacteria bacterium RIFCSPHIGHO2_01_FULL_43_42]|uniref:Uncharacterized protein n=1 Tax=Candidatus Yanofskybacteria bacterium RIFCSPLOWO2_01_FULL_43_22 TaxID=1802695 RepID=A0A1F8GFE4_9BACT|nr:MAG: hypothetical protein A2655_01105 [Candidatus Yanofskybacteria bacterium RIFCSPHIGHO2_01_FULL_43_42]OGN12408.1 MAG: hypothetical protein A3D48_01835 [Candidatus Yanofskybacteria bacterium RIFCSPHIGHO2_02_FULL_43_17]OGN23780.1 MAG: hypothetical protein A3A13_01895 [Candidatus Yanofskybacteria bacterium RIFCSPLOWO2_01_FULL_43_22]